MDLKELENVDPDQHWYYQTKLIALLKNLSRHGYQGGLVIDVGAGSGFFSTRIVGEYQGSRAICVDPHYASEQLVESHKVTFTRGVKASDTKQASLLLFIDVSEHVQDDLDLLQQYTGNATPGTLVAITVPAFKTLWSGHDVFLEHFRRYRRKEVVTLARQAGLDVVHSQYLYGSTFLPLWVVRRTSRDSTPKSHMRPISSWLNFVLRYLVGMEHQLCWNPAFGSSVLVLAKVRG